MNGTQPNLTLFGPLRPAADARSADERAIYVTMPVVRHPQVEAVIRESRLSPTEQIALLRGISDKMAIYQIAVAARGREMDTASEDIGPPGTRIIVRSATPSRRCHRIC